MANPFVALVNEAIYKSKLQADLISEIEQQHDQSAKMRTLLLSHREACVYHLVCAYRLFLLELAHAQNLVVQSLHSAAELLALGESAEATRLLQLEQAAGSFLATILSEERRAWTGQLPTTPAVATELIETANISEQSSPLTGYIDALKQLVGECRETLIEW